MVHIPIQIMPTTTVEYLFIYRHGRDHMVHVPIQIMPTTTSCEFYFH